MGFKALVRKIRSDVGLDNRIACPSNKQLCHASNDNMLEILQEVSNKDQKQVIANRNVVDELPEVCQHQNLCREKNETHEMQANNDMNACCCQFCKSLLSCGCVYKRQVMCCSVLNLEDNSTDSTITFAIGLAKV